MILTKPDLAPLTYVVQCKWRPMYADWTAIAAFDLDVIAIDYAELCQKSKPPGCSYRVITREQNPTSRERGKWCDIWIGQGALA